MELGLGNNYSVNWKLRLMSGGETLFQVSDRDGDLLAELNVWDRDGNRVAKLLHGAWVFHELEYDVSTSPQHLTLSLDGKVLVDLQKPRDDYVWVRELDLWTKDGHHLIIAPRSGTSRSVMERTKASCALGRVQIWRVRDDDD